MIKGVRLYGEMHRFLPAVANWDGASVTEVEVNHRVRKFGKSKYNLKRIRAVFLDLIAMKFFTSYVNKPIRIFGRFSIWSFGLAMLVFIDRMLNMNKSLKILAQAHDVSSHRLLKEMQVEKN